MPYLNVKQGCEVGRAQLGCLGNVQEVQVQPKVVVPGSDCTSTGGSQGWKEEEGGGGGGGGREREEGRKQSTSLVRGNIMPHSHMTMVCFCAKIGTFWKTFSTNHGTN